MLAATVASLVFIAAPAPSIAPPGMTMSSVSAEADPVAPDDVVVERGYGLQILAMDAAGIGLLVLGGSMDDGGGDDTGQAVMTAGLLTLGFGPGIVHATHGRGGAAVASMLLRPTAVYGGALIGASMEDCSNSEALDFCGLGGAILGGLVGYGAVALFDATYLAREKRTPRSWAPSVAASSDGVRLGIGGSF